MKRRSRPFNDEIYCQTVEEFEDKTFADRASDAGFHWAMIMLAPVLMIGQAVAGLDWRKWVAVLGAAYLTWLVFSFLHEINENVRYVRHQLRVFRDAFSEVGGCVERFPRTKPEEYQNRENFSIADALEWLNREWEYPNKNSRFHDNKS
jgi:hypothetical protein